MKSLFLLIVFFFTFSNLIAQDSKVELKTFDKNGVKFNYFSDWEITDKSLPGLLNLYITKPNTSILIIISSPEEEIVSGKQYTNLQREANTKYAELISKTLSSSDKKAQEEWLCLNFKERKISGRKFSGIYQNESATGEVYPFTIGNRFVTLVFYKADKDIVTANLYWRDFVESLAFEGSDKKANLELSQNDTVQGGIINDKATKLVKPKYSKFQYEAGARGRVEVLIEVDETGKVVYAQAVSGHPLLYAEAENAAKNQNSPRLCYVIRQLN